MTRCPYCGEPFPTQELIDWLEHAEQCSPQKFKEDTQFLGYLLGDWKKAIVKIRLENPQLYAWLTDCYKQGLEFRTKFQETYKDAMS